jgi:hypothetical protein
MASGMLGPARADRAGERIDSGRERGCASSARRGNQARTVVLI